MTTITQYNHPGIAIGEHLRIAGVEHADPYVVYEHTATTLTIARETWIARVIRWNPCNPLELALRVW